MTLKKYISLSAKDSLILALVFIISSAAVSGSRLSRLTNSKSVASSQTVDIYLDNPIDLNELSTILADSGVVKSREELIWAGKLLGWRSFNRGHYQIDGEYSYDVLLSRMARGIQDPVSVTLIPGSTKERLINMVARKMHFDSTEFAKVINDTALLAELDIDQKDVIGRMLPNTYSMYWTNEPETVFKKILNEFDKLVYSKNKERFEELKKSVDEIITLASIIEWEANKKEEKKIISGVYWNRLNRGMRLQADPTVNFALDERRRLLYEDYQINHPYNTYVNKGLPPGPITNPDLSSIEAALYPADHDYLYMVASPNGYHLFSETFEEHKKKSEEWRSWLREQYRKKREQEQKESENSE